MMIIVAREPAASDMEVRSFVVHDCIWGVDRMSRLIERTRHTKVAGPQHEVPILAQELNVK